LKRLLLLLLLLKRLLLRPLTLLLLLPRPLTLLLLLLRPLMLLLLLPRPLTLLLPLPPSNSGPRNEKNRPSGRFFYACKKRSSRARASANRGRGWVYAKRT